MSSRLKLFNTRIFTLATHQESEKDLSRAKPFKASSSSCRSLKRLLQTNSSKTTFDYNVKKFKSRLFARGYPKNLMKKHYQMSNLQKGHRH